MNRLLNRHYKAIRKRGLITDSTTKYDFIEKMIEEWAEIKYSNESDIDQEIIDLMMVCSNFLIHRGCNVKKEIRKNLKTQQRRAEKMKV